MLKDVADLEIAAQEVKGQLLEKLATIGASRNGASAASRVVKRKNSTRGRG